MRQVAVFPENPNLCKYGSKHLSDDDAIGLLEQFLAKVRLLQEIGDDSEDWTARERWLLRVIADLWTYRGLYPGLLRTLEAAEGHCQVSRCAGMRRLSEEIVGITLFGGRRSPAARPGMPSREFGDRPPRP
jgi:hypothetical protein